MHTLKPEQCIVKPTHVYRRQADAAQALRVKRKRQQLNSEKETQTEEKNK